MTLGEKRIMSGCGRRDVFVLKDGEWTFRRSAYYIISLGDTTISTEQ